MMIKRKVAKSLNLALCDFASLRLIGVYFRNSKLS